MLLTSPFNTLANQNLRQKRILSASFKISTWVELATQVIKQNILCKSPLGPSICGCQSLVHQFNVVKFIVIWDTYIKIIRPNDIMSINQGTTKNVE